MRTQRNGPLALILAAGLLLAACGGTDGTPPADDDAATQDAAADQEDPAASELLITDVRSRMSPRRAGVAAVYLTIENPTDRDDALVRASVPPDVAEIVEVHETFRLEDDDADDGHMGHGEEGMHDGAMEHGEEDGHDGAMEHGEEGMHDGEHRAPMMGMREIDAIEIPAGETVELVPGGLHIMLIDLVEDLEVGDRFEVTLTFEHAGDVTVTAEVRAQV